MAKGWLHALLLITMLSMSFSIAHAVCVDVDEDGYGEYDDVACTGSGDDCVDTDSSINPGAAEVCDDYLDNNCNGFIDEGESCTSIVCGNLVCDEGETSVSCSSDCSGIPDEPEDACGDFVCGISEDDASCPKDCKDYSSCNITRAEMYNSNNALINYSNVGSTVKLVASIEKIGGLVSYCDKMPISFLILEIDNLEDDGPSEVVTLYANTTSGKAEFFWVPSTIEDEDDDPGQDGFEPNAAELVMIGYYSVNPEEIYLPTRFIKIFPKDFIPSTDQQSGGSFSGDVQADSSEDACGDSACDSATENATSCPADCISDVAEPLPGEDEPLPGTCTISSVSWADETGASFETIEEGSKATLSADVTGCDASSIQFLFMEYDAGDDNPGNDDLLPDVTDATVSNGKATADWAAVYIGDEPDPATGDTYPEFILIAFDASATDEQSAAMLQSDTAFVVYKANSAAPENVDTSVEVSPDLIPDASDQQTGITESRYRAGTGARSAAGETETEDEPGCGDGVCDLTEDEETCPDDCAEAGNLTLIIIIVFALLLVGGGIGFFLWRKRRNKVAEAAAKPAEQNNASSAQPANPAQPAKPIQTAQPQSKPAEPPKSPFANEDQLKATANFIRTARTQGISDEKIKLMLKNGNYSQQQIDYALSSMK